MLRQLGSREGIAPMATAYYSTIFQEPAADIWQIVRDFNNYPIWIDGCDGSRI
jgi:ribosome-associated toxin RatA of RatAB toxin-antitoxin module